MILVFNYSLPSAIHSVCQATVLLRATVIKNVFICSWLIAVLNVSRVNKYFVRIFYTLATAKALKRHFLITNFFGYVLSKRSAQPVFIPNKMVNMFVNGVIKCIICFFVNISIAQLFTINVN